MARRAGTEDDPSARLAQLQGTAAGTTIQLGADFLTYVRARHTPVQFKNELVERLLPTVPRKGRPRAVVEGETFGKFQIDELLGKGGMAAVYRAIDPERGSGSDFGPASKRDPHVALKVMRDDIAHDPEYVKRFLREAANAALVSHPNVVTVFEVGSVDGRLYFTMELIDGETLKDTLARGPLDESRGLQVMCQLVDGLMAAHARGIGHRDLKPANVMLATGKTRGGGGQSLALQGEFDVQVKVTDFGLAHMLDADQSDDAAEGKFLGTAKYVAPEVIKGEEATLKSDVFSLGILAFQVFAGRAPFQVKTKMEFVTANLNAEAPALDTLCPVSKDLARLVAAMLEKDPAQRPDAASLRKDLGRLAGRRRGESVVVQDDPSSAFHRAINLPAPRAGLAPVAASVGGVAVLALVGVLLLRPSAKPQPPARLPVPVTAPSTTRTPPIGVGHGGQSGVGHGGQSMATPPRPAQETVGTVAELGAIPVPPRSSFKDDLARAEFLQAVETGDAAWTAGRAAEALGRWQRGAALAPSLREAFALRLLEGQVAAGLEAATEAERRKDPHKALAELEAAISLGGERPALVAARARVRARLEGHAKLDRSLSELRPLLRQPDAREGAIASLRALLPLARELGREDEVEGALARLGATEGPPGPPPVAPPIGPPAPPAVDPRLERAAELLALGSLEAAEAALKQAREAGVAGPRLRALEGRLERARRTPAGMKLVELPAAPDALPDAIYVRPARTSNRAWKAWLEKQAGTIMPPRSWHGASSPPRGEEDAPVLGVSIELARRFAEASGERLPSPAELTRLREVLGASAPQGDPGGGRFEDGFWTVLEPGGGRQ